MLSKSENFSIFQIKLDSFIAHYQILLLIAYFLTRTRKKVSKKTPQNSKKFPDYIGIKRSLMLCQFFHIDHLKDFQLFVVFLTQF